MAPSELRHDMTSDGAGLYRNSSKNRSASWFASRACTASRADFVRTVIERQADPALATDLRLMAPDTTDDLPDR
jgi:hypothetical protein